MKKTLISGLAVCLLFNLGVQNNDANASTAATKSAATTQAPGALTGTVLETMDSGGYTYFQLDTGLDKAWVAVPQAQIKVGDTISSMPGMVMKNFTSKTLNRTFDSIVFSGGLAGAGAKNSAPHGGMGGMKSGGGDDSFASAVAAEGGGRPSQVKGPGTGGSAGAMVPFSEIKVDKASGDNAQLVGDAFANRKKLNGKTIRVQGKVVKVSPMIMGRNWIHLQDGSGDPANNTHDLVFTTEADTIEKGKVITMEGVLTANKDFGSGYKYDAIVEEAKVVE